MIGPVLLDYYACDLSTGLVLEELHSFTPSGALGRRLGLSTTANGSLVIAGAPPGWIDATTPGRSMIVAVDRAAQIPIWAGIVVTRERGSDSTASIGMMTPEGYFDRRYTGSYTTAVTTDQAVILTGTGAALLVDGPNFSFDAPASGLTLDSYSVADGDDRTVLSVWQEIMGAEGGAEWTVDPVWQDAARTTVQLVIRIRSQVGGLRSDNPETVFDLPGSVTSYKQTESYESGKGATETQANGNGQGATRLTSGVFIASDLLAAGWPLWVYRFTAASGLDDPVQLNLHANEALVQMRTGASSWTVTAVASQAPHVGVDWGLGASVHLAVAAGESPGHPDGADVVARAYGWDLDVSTDAATISPILIEGG